MPRNIVLYTRPGSIMSGQVEALLFEAGVTHRTTELVSRAEQEALSTVHQAPGFPMVVVDGIYIGGFPEVIQLHATGRLSQLLTADPTELRRQLEASGVTQPAWTVGRARAPRRSSEVSVSASHSTASSRPATARPLRPPLPGARTQATVPRTQSTTRPVKGNK
jgi:glutaredoxin